MKKNTVYTLALVAGALTLASCGQDRNGWTLKGKVDGADKATLYIEKSSGPGWVLQDSVITDNDGNFEYVAIDPQQDNNQPIYRIRMADRGIYFTVNGTETLTLAASAKDFGNKYSMSGNPAVAAFTTVDSIISATVDRVGAHAALTDSLMITQLGNVIVTDTTGVASYYTVTRSIDGAPVFTTDMPLKIRLLGAAANIYATHRPGDPRGAEITAAYARAKAGTGHRTKGVTMEAGVAGRPEIEFVRNDVNGQPHDLNKVLDRGGVTVLNMSRFDAPGSSANTAALGQAFTKYGSQGLVVYQISFDPNEALWRQNAVRIPWTVVYNSADDPANICMLYNVDPVNGNPVSFVFNRHGEIVARVSNPADLEKELAKLF